MSLFEEAQLLASSSQSSKERLQAAQNCGPGLVWAEQKSGVHLTHTVQASTLASIAVGPSFRFRSPPVTWQAERERSIAVIPQTHADQIWSWSTDQTERDGSFAAEPPRKVFKCNAQLLALCALSNNRLVYSTQSGAIHLCDFSYSANIALSPLSSSEIPHAATTPHHRLTSHPANPSSFALFTFEQSSSPHKKGKAKDASQNVHFSLFSIDEHNNIHIDCSHPFSGHGHPILDVSYAHTKRILTILDQAGHWLHYSIHPDTSAVQPLRHLQLLQRYNFATPSHSDLSVAAPSYLLATHDAFALLALPTYDALLLTLWDLKYGILLAETSLHSGRPTLVHCFQGLAVLLLASPTGDTRVYAQPYNLPDVSTLSLVIGRAPVTQSYLEQTTDASPTQQQQRRDKLASLIKNPLDKPASVALAELQQQHCNSCLADVRSHERPESLDVDALFGEWLGKCVRDLQQHHLKHPGKQSNTSKAKAKEALEAGQEISPPQLRTQLPLLDKAGHRFLLHGVTSGLDPLLPFNFVEDVLQTMRSAPSTSCKTFRYLLDRKVVYDHMLHPSVTLWAHQHLDHILTSYTISHAHAIPEQVLVSVFKTTKHREKEAAYLLASIVERPSNHAELSKAMASLTVEELQTMFSIILSWNDAGPIGFRPSLGPLVHFVSALLDAHFITILQDAALSDLVVRLHKELQGLTQLSAALAGLKGSLTMVRREQDRAFKPLHNEKEMKQMRKAKKSMIEDYQVELLEV